MPTIKIETLGDVETHERLLFEAAERAAGALRGLASGSGLEMLHAIKFLPIGHHPGTQKALNLIEQVNQTFTYLVTFEAVRYLLEHHPKSGPWTLNLGTSKGFDIESRRRDVVAEVFAAVHAQNNGKLSKDLARVTEAKVRHGYVFFHAPSDSEVRLPAGPPGIKVVYLSLKDPMSWAADRRAT